MPFHLLPSDPRAASSAAVVATSSASSDPGVAGGTVVDLAARRAATRAAERAAAKAPVRHLPAALLEALQGSWGTPEELLAGRTFARRLAVAR